MELHGVGVVSGIWPLGVQATSASRRVSTMLFSNGRDISVVAVLVADAAGVGSDAAGILG
jgi:hypothetical protein